MFKNFKLIGTVCLIMAMLVSFSSCSNPEKQIIGKWKVTKARFDGDDYEPEGEKWIFKENGKCTISIYGAEHLGHYSIKNGTLSIDVKYYENGDGQEMTGDLDLDEFNKKEMSVSGTVKLRAYEDGQWDYYYYPCRIYYELEKL